MKIKLLYGLISILITGLGTSVLAATCNIEFERSIKFKRSNSSLRQCKGFAQALANDACSNKAKNIMRVTRISNPPSWVRVRAQVRFGNQRLRATGRCTLRHIDGYFLGNASAGLDFLTKGACLHSKKTLRAKGPCIPLYQNRNYLSFSNR